MLNLQRWGYTFGNLFTTYNDGSVVAVQLSAGQILDHGLPTEVKAGEP